MEDIELIRFNEQNKNGRTYTREHSGVKALSVLNGIVGDSIIPILSRSQTGNIISIQDMIGYTDIEITDDGIFTKNIVFFKDTKSSNFKEAVELGTLSIVASGLIDGMQNGMVENFLISFTFLDDYNQPWDDMDIFRRKLLFERIL